MSLYKRIKSILTKAFVGGDWKVAYRPIGTSDCQYQIVDTPGGTWAADPFLYEADGEHYLFVELCIKKKDKGVIAYYRFIDGMPIYQGIIIDSTYHMSYPCVFSYNGEHFMIPETADNESIDLYKAVDFPAQWSKVAALRTCEKYVDTTVFCLDNKYYAVSYRKISRGGWTLDFFELDMRQYKLYKIGSKEYRTNIGRPAGNFYVQSGLVRPAQNCSLKYGEDIILNKVATNGKKYEEQENGRIKIADIDIPIKAQRIHTYNTDATYEVVDLYVEKFNPLHGVKTFWRAYLKKYFKG